MRVRSLVALVVSLWATALAVHRSLRRVEGPSMLPGLADGDLVLTLPLRRRPRVGEVVVADLPGVGPTIKRVVATPREDVVLDGGTLRVDGVVRDEPQALAARDGRHHWPPGDGVVLLGDNRPRSTDSRRHGRIAPAAVTRRVVGRLPVPQR